MKELKVAIENLGAVRNQLEHLEKDTEKILAITQTLYGHLAENHNSYGFDSGERLLDLLEDKVADQSVVLEKLYLKIDENVKELSELFVNKDLLKVKSSKKII